MSSGVNRTPRMSPPDAPDPEPARACASPRVPKTIGIASLTESLPNRGAATAKIRSG